MYFEARSHQSIPVADAHEAVNRIHTGNIHAYQCPTWRNKLGQRVALVDDSHINCGDFGECAAVNLDTSEQTTCGQLRK